MNRCQKYPGDPVSLYGKRLQLALRRLAVLCYALPKGSPAVVQLAALKPRHQSQNIPTKNEGAVRSLVGGKESSHNKHDGDSGCLPRGRARRSVGLGWGRLLGAVPEGLGAVCATFVDICRPVIQ